jgi:DNA-binding CsgD family transcriptional regulator
VAGSNDPALGNQKPKKGGALLNRFGIGQKDGTDNSPFQPVSPLDDDKALLDRTKQLIGDEFEIYKWLREFYTPRWIAETLLIERRATKIKIRAVCHKLGVRNRKSLIRVYNRLPRPRKGPVNTEEIDKYADDRQEAEIQRELEAEQIGKEANS